MTNKRRRDKESCAGCHRKRTKPRVRRSTLGYGDVSTSATRVAKHLRSGGFRFPLRCFCRRTGSCSAACSRFADGPPESHRVPDCFLMKPRFEPDLPSGANEGLSPTLIDPEAYDATEQTFAASLEQTASTPPRKFVVEEGTSEAAAETVPENALRPLEEVGREMRDVASAADSRQSSDPDSWRREIAARLTHYRARRRPREPRYPSLQLKFETEQVWQASTSTARPIPAAAARQTVDHVLSATAPRIRLDEPSDYA